MARSKRNDDLARLAAILLFLAILAWTYRTEIIAWIVQSIENFLNSLINAIISSLPTIVVLVLGLYAYHYLTENNRLSEDQASVGSLILVTLPLFLPQIWIANVFINGYVIIFGLGAVLAILLRLASEAAHNR